MESVWKKNIEIPRRGRLEKGLHTKVAVIGAGMAGLLTAYLLQEQGVETVVLEAGRIQEAVRLPAPLPKSHPSIT